MKFFLDTWYFFLAAAVSGGLLLWPMLTRGTLGGHITAAETVRLINREKAVLLDVSDPAEYAAGHAIGARSAPLAGLEKSTALPKNKTLPVVLVCQTGTRASRAAATLKGLGFEKASVLGGGLRAWREANLPVERSA